MMNDRTFPIPSNTISVKSEDYTNKSLQMDSNPATMEKLDGSVERRRLDIGRGERRTHLQRSQ